MKIVYAIIQPDDEVRVTKKLNENKFSVTRLASTGGFLRKGNTTLLIGTEDEKVEQIIKIIRENCGTRKQVVYNTPYAPGVPLQTSYMAMPLSVDVGGAVIFVVNVERFEKV